MKNVVKKVMSPLLISLTLAVSFLFAGEVKAENEEPGSNLCDYYCNWCGDALVSTCELTFCQEAGACQPVIQQLILCLKKEAICVPSVTGEHSICITELNNFQTCKSLLPVCGDGWISGEEECDVGNPFYGDECAPNCKLTP